MKSIKYFSIPVILIFLFSFINIDISLKVNGNIVDANTGESLIGVNIIEDGTTNATISDHNGSFSIDVTNERSVLLISYVGYETKHFKLKGKDLSNLVINLNQAAELEEVVIKRKSLFKLGSPIFSESTGISGGIVNASAHQGYDNSTAYQTEDYDLIQENKFHRAVDEPVSTFSIDVDAASYSNMRRFINNGQKPPKDAIRIEEMINYFKYEYPEPNGEDPFSVQMEFGENPWNKNHKLLHIGIQGKQIPSKNLPASNLVFLIDVSGSMQAPNKLQLLKSSLKMLVNNLREQDKVSLVVYAGAAGVVLEPTSGIEKQRIKDAIDELEAGGSTSGAAGIKLAYKTASKHFIEGGNNRVLLATDGDFNLGVSSDAELSRMIEKERESNVFLTVLGFGMGNYKDNKMQKLANLGNGNHAYIDNISEARKVLVSEFGGTMYTIAKDVKLQVEFNPKTVAAYRLIGYENRLLERQDFNDDKKDAGELGSGHTVTAIYEIIPIGAKSDFLVEVDDLKYQESRPTKTAKNSDELMHLKLRYKTPDQNDSKLLEFPVRADAKDFALSSNNFQWSACVAEFGMLLRESAFKGDSNYQDLIDLANKSIGKDLNGYRAEMIRLMQFMMDLESTELVKHKE